MNEYYELKDKITKEIKELEKKKIMIDEYLKSMRELDQKETNKDEKILFDFIQGINLSYIKFKNLPCDVCFLDSFELMEIRNKNQEAIKLFAKYITIYE
jgi:hypothetical protein